jgi:hypothetical protein
MPLMMPLAIAGVAPRRITKVIAFSLSWNSSTAAGNQAIDGIVSRPVMSEPTARRRTLTRATETPSATPSTRAIE